MSQNKQKLHFQIKGRTTVLFYMLWYIALSHNEVCFVWLRVMGKPGHWYVYSCHKVQYETFIQFGNAVTLWSWKLFSLFNCKKLVAPSILRQKVCKNCSRSFTITPIPIPGKKIIIPFLLSFKKRFCFLYITILLQLCLRS